MSDLSTEYMADLEQRYRRASGLQSRDHYSIFYGPLRPSRLMMVNANPGGSPTNYKVVRVEAGEHEYVEGRESGPTTRNGAQILAALAGTSAPEAIRQFQVFNRFFRRTPTLPNASLTESYMHEAAPFLAELIAFVRPEAMLFGGDAGVRLFAKVHGGNLVERDCIMGPNGRAEAVYHRRYELTLPYYPTIEVHGIYHPAKMNSVFRQRVLPRLVKDLAPLVRRAV